ncbi:hypothetical protein [Breoghania sp.]|uniref:hypothetical protein n=1 Tax=Breoghania sp. TaxID=2065378 RepID=UPI002AA6CABA|nr:hypothetical protein [Breoghania sp.]
MDAYDELSDDNHVAFLQLEAEFRRAMEIADERPNSNWSHLSADYMNKTLAAASALGIDAISDFTVSTRDFDEHRENFDDFLRAVDNVIVQMRISRSRNRNAMSAGLTEAQKTKIHHFIEKIRSEVESSSAPAAKKERIFDIIAALAKEISKARTGFERFTDLARSLAGLSGDIEREGARPWWPWFEKIMGVLNDAKVAEPQLPRPPEIRKIEPPHKKLPKPEGYGQSGNADLDDEIPF